MLTSEIDVEKWIKIDLLVQQVLRLVRYACSENGIPMGGWKPVSLLEDLVGQYMKHDS